MSFTGHLPAENGLPPYSISSTTPSVPVSSATSSSNNTQNSTSDQHVCRLSSSPSLSVNSRPSPIPSNTTPPHLEQSSVGTPLKPVSQTQDSLDKIGLDASHFESSHREYSSIIFFIEGYTIMATLGNSELWVHRKDFLEKFINKIAVPFSRL